MKKSSVQAAVNQAASASARAEAAIARGISLQNAGDCGAARAAFEAALALQPRNARAHIKRGEALRREGRLDEALAACQSGIDLDPNNLEGRMIRGVVRAQRGETLGAAEDFAEALRINPNIAVLEALLGEMLLRLGRLEEARAALMRGLALDPGNGTMQGALGCVLQGLGLATEAGAAFRRAIALNPADAMSQTQLAGLLLGAGDWTGAAAAARAAVAGQPPLIKAHLYLAQALRRLGRPEEALDACRQALIMAPDDGEALALLCDLKQQVCDWTGLAAEEARRDTHSWRKGRRIAVFPLLASIDAPADHRDCARVWAAGLQPAGAAPAGLATAPVPRKRAGEKLKIGYLSADFRHHAVAMLIAEVFERHDRHKFEVFGYSIGQDDGSAMRRRLAQAFDRFVDLVPLPDEAAARHIASDEIDILIDLNGYTTGARTAILARRPAAIQVNFLGFPATMGASFMDYILVDRFVVPPEAQPFFDEKLVHLPHCYQPNDGQRPLPPAPPSRSDVGLPEQGFVFCCFNTAHKINAAMFDIWMRLLRHVPDAVLWLLEANPAITRHLREEAGARGIDARRLIFAPLVDTERHLARQRCADLFLDTTPYNAHTTASDALWVGLPVLTLAGRAFASRVAGSLLRAVGLPELITASPEEYEALALRLAHEPRLLALYRERLARHRLTTPVFDSARFTRNLETALSRMAALNRAGLSPCPFEIEDTQS
jgi:predicted O-linked N-acetylglucosamine transferase (SPINDLY family)